MIIGHHMGTNSRDVFLELAFLLPEKSARFPVFYDQITHGISEPVRQVSREYQLAAAGQVARQVDVTASYGFGRIENPGNVTGPAREVNAFRGEKVMEPSFSKKTLLARGSIL